MEQYYDRLYRVNIGVSGRRKSKGWRKKRGSTDVKWPKNVETFYGEDIKGTAAGQCLEVIREQGMSTAGKRRKSRGISKKKDFGLTNEEPKTVLLIDEEQITSTRADIRVKESEGRVMAGKDLCKEQDAEVQCGRGGRHSR